jgi:flagellar motor switch protein FliM
VTDGIVRSFKEALRSRLDLAVEATTGDSPTDASVCVVLSLSIAGGGVVAIAVPVGALGEAEVPAETSDGRIAAAMVDVEVDVVAELGKVRVSLRTLAGLAVGDILQLSLPLDERARVCAGGAVLFRGRPTASGLTIGIAIERHAT